MAAVRGQRGLEALLRGRRPQPDVPPLVQELRRRVRVQRGA